MLKKIAVTSVGGDLAKISSRSLILPIYELIFTRYTQAHPYRAFPIGVNFLQYSLLAYALDMVFPHHFILTLKSFRQDRSFISTNLTVYLVPMNNIDVNGC